MKKVGVPLQSLSEILPNSYFRIPDYQRGYAWEKPQVDDILKDIDHLLGLESEVISSHYTGTLVVTAAGNHNDNPVYEVVDGQQRLTTLAIIVGCLINKVEDKKYFKELQSLYHCRGDVGNEYFVLQLNNETRVFFENVVLGSESEREYPATLNAHKNLLSARKIIERWINGHLKNSTSTLEQLLNVVLKRLGFIVYAPMHDAEVGIMFEVINNRGKDLSELEKVKNYLIYCCAKMGTGQLREYINDSWAQILRGLTAAGKTSNQEESAFLRYCAIVFFQFNKSESHNSYKELKKKFDVDSICQTNESKADACEQLKSFVSFMTSAAYWYKALYAPETVQLEQKLADSLELLRAQNHHASIMPLILAVLIRSKGEGSAALNHLKLLEILNFRVYLANNITKRSDTGQGDLFGYAIEYYENLPWQEEWSFAASDRNINNYDLWLEVMLVQFIKHHCSDGLFEESFYLDENENWMDFYKWTGLRYFLMSYESYLQPKKTISIDRILLKPSDKKTNDYFSVEHIWATENRSNEGENDRFQDQFQKRRLGNFCLLELGINIQSSNQDIEDKIAVYFGENSDHQITELAHVKLTKDDTEEALEELSEMRRTKNYYSSLASELCDRQEERYVKFAMERWSVDDYLGAEDDSDEDEE
ncbi:hypothetical protein EOPP23_14725 [Endozoicomonas sp. OPT23]|uniref:DUF262 domain-containing protein n=1 Tax=Endozoicomonas sp. OPT23 TaxID=2072845 RepID=UPI00129A9EA2|nr:DUF262 domain-containing protein [Endozoicomonas sp. OPT23]MRI34246.1 hypothetical protein [Endozoicomonas sp. OPT23]